MNMKKILAVVSSAIIMSFSTVSASAVESNSNAVSENNPVNSQTTVASSQIETTTAPEESTQTETYPETTQEQWETTTPETENTEESTEQTTEESTEATTVEEDASATAAEISLGISQVKNGRFTAKLKINSEANVANAKIRLKYDPKTILYIKSSPNYDIGGNCDAKSGKGSVLVNYTNSASTAFDGTYTTLTFKIKDNTVASTVIYLEVVSLKNELGQNIPHNENNGVVTNNEYAETTAEKIEYKPLSFKLEDSPVTLADLGIKDILSCEVENSDVILYAKGMLKLVKPGKSKLTVIHKNGSKEYYEVTVEKPAETTVAANTEKKDNSDNGKFIWIFVVVILVAVGVIALCLIIYFTTVKSKKNSEDDEDDDFEEDDDDEEYDEDEDSDEEYEDDDYDEDEEDDDEDDDE